MLSEQSPIQKLRYNCELIRFDWFRDFNTSISINWSINRVTDSATIVIISMKVRTSNISLRKNNLALCQDPAFINQMNYMNEIVACLCIQTRNLWRHGKRPLIRLFSSLNGNMRLLNYDCHPANLSFVFAKPAFSLLVSLLSSFIFSLCIRTMHI